ncbi:MAG: winged helix-turn-helix domain-containing protein [Methanocellales archaeon]|nr:winged helix-turn-helix domain-containing protein [Methanocellales archaeon]
MPLEILNRKYLPDILLAIKHDTKSFNGIMKELRMSPDTLSNRIKDLTKYNLIEAVLVQVNGKNRIKYQLTKKGKDMLPEIEEFVRLSKKIENRIKS